MKRHVDPINPNIGINAVAAVDPILGIVSAKVIARQEVGYEDVRKLLKVATKTSLPIVKKNAVDLLMAILDKRYPKPARSADLMAKNILNYFVSESNLENISLNDAAILTIASYLDNGRCRNSATKALIAIKVNNPLPKQASDLLAQQKGGLAIGGPASSSAAPSPSGSLAQLNEQHMGTVQSSSNQREAEQGEVGQREAEQRARILSRMIQGLAVRSGEGHYQLSKKTLGYSKLNPGDEGLVNIAKGLPYEDAEKTQEILTYLKKLYLRNKHAPDFVIAKLIELEALPQIQAESIEEFIPAALIATNQDGAKPRHVLIDEIGAANKNNHALSSWLSGASNELSRIDETITQDSQAFPQGKAIDNWQAEDILAWSEAVSKEHINEDLLYELIAVASQGVRLHKGYAPRDIQTLSVLALLNKQPDQGRLIQVKTGEGKTIICAMLACITAFRNKQPVDVITSSSVLAERDSAEQVAYFSLFGLSCSNLTRGDSNAPKECYTADILYGSASDFQGDYLRDEFKRLGTRSNRVFGSVIVDEVDSMLVDDGAKITKLSSPRPGTEYLAPIFMLTWKAIANLEITDEVLSNKGLRGELTEQIQARIEAIIDGEYFSYPSYLLGYISSQIKNWANSALAASVMREDKHYVIAQDIDSGADIIAPVDYINSGVVQNKTSWGNGVHQFLQVKHSLMMSAESVTTSYISNMSFFMKYGANIMGMTGTLGSTEAKSLLGEVYHIDTAVIPKFKPDLFHEEEAIITSDEATHKAAILSAATEVANSGRAVLIISESIAFAKELTADLQAICPPNKVHIYSRTDMEEMNAVSNIQEAGNIIVATNLAGRGTDIKLTDEVNENGGLHVIITFLPSNLRVEEQAFGRTARQGQPGSGRLVLNGAEEASKLSLEADSSANTDSYKAIRDLSEKIRLAEVKEVRLPKISFEDRLFERFNQEIYQHLRTTEENRYKLAQLEESWGFWLKDLMVSHKNSENPETQSAAYLEFEAFKQEQIALYNSDVATSNPIYQIQMGHSRLGRNNSYDESIRLLEQVAKPEDPYSFAGHYYLAYAYLRKNLAGKAKNDQGLVAAAYRHMHIAKSHLEEVIIPQLQSMQLLLGTNSAGSPISTQITNKVDLFNHHLSYINHALKFIESSNPKNIMTVGKTKRFEEFYAEGQAPMSEIRELNSLGAMQLYELDAKKPPKNILTSVVVIIIGVAQVAVGTMMAMASGGTLGIGLIASGLGDMYQGINAALKGEGIHLGEYFKAKAIEFAINVISQGIADKLRPAAKAGAVVKKGAELSTGQLLFKIGTRVGMRLAADQVVVLATKELSRGALKKAINRAIRSARRELESRLSSPRIAAHLENMLAIDNLYNRKYSRQLSSAARDFFTRRSSEL
ncbi:MAG: hypothetical protein COA94_08340, partial [Rickettsiales bacterium]